MWRACIEVCIYVRSMHKYAFFYSKASLILLSKIDKAHTTIYRCLIGIQETENKHTYVKHTYISYYILYILYIFSFAAILSWYQFSTLFLSFFNLMLQIAFTPSGNWYRSFIRSNRKIEIELWNRISALKPSSIYYSPQSNGTMRFQATSRFTARWRT